MQFPEWTYPGQIDTQRTPRDAERGGPAQPARDVVNGLEGPASGARGSPLPQGIFPLRLCLERTAPAVDGFDSKRRAVSAYLRFLITEGDDSLAAVADRLRVGGTAPTEFTRDCRGSPPRRSHSANRIHPRLPRIAPPRRSYSANRIHPRLPRIAHDSTHRPPELTSDAAGCSHW